MARRLSGMTVLITGASAGIGEALARELAASGARLALVARREDRLQALATELGEGHLALPGDIARAEDCQRVVGAAVAGFGRLDTLVCNAGIGLFSSVEATSRTDWDRIFAVNLHGTLDCIRAVVPTLRAQEPRAGWRGQVMIVSSILGRRAAPGCAAYCATKAAQLSLAEALRLELKPDRIAVTSVHPVGTRTGFFTAAARDGEPVMVRTSAFDQSADHVARRMRRAIARPCPEVWPSRPSRWVAGLGTLMPRLADALVARLAPK